MGRVLISETILRDIANQIRNKLDIPQKIAVCDMPDRISEIEGVNIQRQLQTFATYANSASPQSFIREGHYVNFGDANTMILPLDPLELTPLVVDFSAPWQIGVRFRFKEQPTTTQAILGSYNGLYKAPSIELDNLESMHLLSIRYSVNGSSWYLNQTLYIPNGLQIDEWYFIKLGWDGWELIASITDDFINWDEDYFEAETPGYSGTDSIPIFGATNRNQHLCNNTEIDLDSTYIKTASAGGIVWGTDRYGGGE